MIDIPGLGKFQDNNGMVQLETTRDGFFKTGENGICSIFATGDGKVEFASKNNSTLARVNSELGFSAYYPIEEIHDDRVDAVLLDLDGTSVQSEPFWIRMIENTVKRVKTDDRFEFCEEDLPFISGHSVSEHLQYGRDKYCPDHELNEFRDAYEILADYEMDKIKANGGDADSFRPSPGLKELLVFFLKRKIFVSYLLHPDY